MDKVAHRDIKGENLTFDENAKVRYIDFGHAAVVTLMANEQKGTPRYKAAEVYSGNYYSVEKADIYSLGVTLFTVMFQSLPNFNGIRVLKNNFSAFERFFARHYAPGLPLDQRHQIDALSMLWACFSENPADRPSISLLAEVPWIKDAPTQLDSALLGEISTISSLQKHPNDY